MTWLYDGYMGDSATKTCIAREGAGQSLCELYNVDGSYTPIREDYPDLWTFVRLDREEDQRICGDCVDALRAELNADEGRWGRIVDNGGLVPRADRRGLDSEDEDSEDEDSEDEDSEGLGELFG
jgi:hypothetical protein